MKNSDKNLPSKPQLNTEKTRFITLDSLPKAKNEGPSLPQMKMAGIGASVVAFSVGVFMILMNSRPAPIAVIEEDLSEIRPSRSYRAKNQQYGSTQRDPASITPRHSEARSNYQDNDRPDFTELNVSDDYAAAQRDQEEAFQQAQLEELGQPEFQDPNDD